MLFVIVLLVAEVIVVGARVSGAQAVVANATRQAARQGSLVQTQSAAFGAVDRVARDNLNSHGNQCLTIDVAETSSIAPGGSVEVTVRCTVDLSDLSFLGLPLPNTSFSHTHLEPIETYRAVGPRP